MDTGGYTWQWWLNLILVALSILAVICNVVVATVPNGAWLGLTDIQWHWVLVVTASITALNTAFNRTPQVTHPPTTAQLAVETKVQEVRKAS